MSSVSTRYHRRNVTSERNAGWSNSRVSERTNSRGSKSSAGVPGAASHAEAYVRLTAVCLLIFTVAFLSVLSVIAASPVHAAPARHAGVRPSPRRGPGLRSLRKSLLLAAYRTVQYLNRKCSGGHMIGPDRPCFTQDWGLGTIRSITLRSMDPDRNVPRHPRGDRGRRLSGPSEDYTGLMIARVTAPIGIPTGCSNSETLNRRADYTLYLRFHSHRRQWRFVGIDRWTFHYRLPAGASQQMKDEDANPLSHQYPAAEGIHTDWLTQDIFGITISPWVIQTPASLKNRSTVTI